MEWIAISDACSVSRWARNSRWKSDTPCQQKLNSQMQLW